MRRTLVVAFLSAMALVGASNAVLAETNSPQPLSGTLIFTGIPGQVPGRAVFTGAVNAVCTETGTVTFVPGQPTQVVDRFDCPQGTIFNTASVTSTFTLDPTTCIGRQPQSGPFQFTGGTGQFAGITGSGTFTGEGFIIFRRTAEGSCDLSQPPLRVVVLLRFTGTASVPGTV